MTLGAPMQMEAGTVISIVALVAGGVTCVGGWVLSVEKRINGLRALQKSVSGIEEAMKDMSKSMGAVDRRTERLSMFIHSRDVAHEPRPFEGV